MSFVRGGKQYPVVRSTKHNTLLTSPNQPWHLNALLGDELVDRALAENGGAINDAMIVKLLTENPLPFYTDTSQCYLSMGTNELIERDFGPLKPIAPVDALVRFGLAKMEEANERGYSRL